MMTGRQRAKLARLQSVLTYKPLLAPEIRAVPRAAEALETLARIVEQLQQLATHQLIVAVGMSARRAAARERLARQLSLVARAARLLDRQRPRQFDELRVPRPRTEPRLLAAGALFVERTAPHAELFVGYGLPPTFLDDLQASLDDLRRSISRSAGNRRASAAAQINIPVALAEATAAVEALDLALSIRFPNDAGIRAGWARARGLSEPPIGVAPPLFPHLEADPDDEQLETSDLSAGAQPGDSAS